MRQYKIKDIPIMTDVLSMAFHPSNSNILAASGIHGVDLLDLTSPSPSNPDPSSTNPYPVPCFPASVVGSVKSIAFLDSHLLASGTKGKILDLDIEKKQ